MKFRNKFALSYLEITAKGQYVRISGSQFLKWLFGPEKFTGLSRNGPQEDDQYFASSKSLRSCAISNESKTESNVLGVKFGPQS